MRSAREIMAEVAPGLSPDQLLLVAELMAAAAAEGAARAVAPPQETPEERRKRISRETSARHRASRNVTGASPEGPEGHVTERHQMSPGDTSASPLARGVDNPLRLVTTGEVGVVGDAREACSSDDWPKGDARRHANLLVELADSPWLDPMKSHGLVTTTGKLATWKRDGASWEHDVVPVVTGLCGKQRSAVATWGFFDKAIARSIADNRAALDIPEASARPRSTGPPLSYSERADAAQAVAVRRLLGAGE